jgi:hypothetical protein
LEEIEIDSEVAEELEAIIEKEGLRREVKGISETSARSISAR